MEPEQKYVELFWAHVLRGSIKEACWGWLGSKRNKGYGAFCWKAKGGGYIQSRASRFSWIIHNGTIPSGKFVLHRCDNPECTNPEHLFLGTIADNNADMIAKGRHVPGGTKAKSLGVETKYRRGLDHPNAKLTPEIVSAIRQARKSGASFQSLSKQFGIGVSSAWKICKGKLWK